MRIIAARLAARRQRESKADLGGLAWSQRRCKESAAVGSHDCLPIAASVYAARQWYADSHKKQAPRRASVGKILANEARTRLRKLPRFSAREAASASAARACNAAAAPPKRSGRRLLAAGAP